jgi:transcriptional antiterminator RfaH
MDYSTQSRHVRSIRGVLTIVGFGDSPTVVPEEIVEDLRREVQDGETIVIQPQIEIGEEVNVIAGPFQGLRAVVSRVLPARERVAVLLEVLGMEREVEVSTKAVLPDQPHPMCKE